MDGSGMAINKRGVVPSQVQVVDGSSAAVFVNPVETTFGDDDLPDAIAIRLRQAADEAGAC